MTSEISRSNDNSPSVDLRNTSLKYDELYSAIKDVAKVQTTKALPVYNKHEQYFINEDNNQNNHGHYIDNSEKHHVALVKVHKTGSSTLQNIFLRFGDSRNLTFILPHDKEGLGETPYPNMISYSNSLNEKNVVPPPAGRHFEILCCHVIYNSEQFQKYLPNDTYYVGIVREPFSRLESAMRYFKIFPNLNMSEIANSPLKHDKGPHSMFNNRMAFELGFPLKLFPDSGYPYEVIKPEIDDYLHKLDKEFKLIIVNEMMDESLVLMRRMLGWRIQDIIYMKQLVARTEIRRFTEADKEKLKSYLYLDIALYNFAVARLKEQIAHAGSDFMEEVIRFKGIKEIVKSFCSTKVGQEEEIVVEQSQWHPSFSVTKQECKLYTFFEFNFIQKIRMKMYGTINN